MKTQVSTYRALVVSTLILLLLMQYLSWNAYEHVPYEHRGIFDWDGVGSFVSPETYDLMYALWFFLEAVGLLAMYVFLPLGRIMVVAGMLLMIPRAFTAGYTVMTPVLSMVHEMWLISFVFTMGMAFFCRPVLVKFRQNRMT